MHPPPPMARMRVSVRVTRSSARCHPLICTLARCPPKTAVLLFHVCTFATFRELSSRFRCRCILHCAARYSAQVTRRLHKWSAILQGRLGLGLGLACRALFRGLLHSLRLRAHYASHMDVNCMHAISVTVTQSPHGPKRLARTTELRPQLHPARSGANGAVHCALWPVLQTGSLWQCAVASVTSLSCKPFMV